MVLFWVGIWLVSLITHVASMLFRDLYPRKSGLWNQGWLYCSEECFLLPVYLLKCKRRSCRQIELLMPIFFRYFIFTSFWAYKIYYVYGFMLLVFLILMVVTVCVTIVCTYFLLNAEDYRWQWTSFLAAASTSAYVYLYSCYYFFFKTK